MSMCYANILTGVQCGHLCMVQEFHCPNLCTCEDVGTRYVCGGFQGITPFTAANLNAYVCGTA